MHALQSLAEKIDDYVLIVQAVCCGCVGDGMVVAECVGDVQAGCAFGGIAREQRVQYESIDINFVGTRAVHVTD